MLLGQLLHHIWLWRRVHLGEQMHKLAEQPESPTLRWHNHSKKMINIAERKVGKTCREFGHVMKGERMATVVIAV